MKHSIGGLFSIGLCAMILPAAAWAQGFQPSTDRRSDGDQAITLQGAFATTGKCNQACREQPTCFTWTFIRNAPAGQPNCFLGRAHQNPRTDGCCTSGNMR
jgi:hypothetical protein